MAYSDDMKKYIKLLNEHADYNGNLPNYEIEVVNRKSGKIEHDDVAKDEKELKALKKKLQDKYDKSDFELRVISNGHMVKEDFEEDYGVPGEDDMEEPHIDDHNFDDHDVDSDLDNEIGLANQEDDEDHDFDDEGFDHDEHDFGDAEMDHDESEEDVVESPEFNYTGIFNVDGYEIPLIFKSDDIEDFKTILRIMKQSGLTVEAEYKWNSKLIDLDDSE